MIVLLYLTFVLQLYAMAERLVGINGSHAKLGKSISLSISHLQKLVIVNDHL